MVILDDKIVIQRVGLNYFRNAPINRSGEMVRYVVCRLAKFYITNL
jgi:hypothetical protein